MKVRLVLRCSVLAAVLAPVLAGCGIRATEVPTDFGAAPSRAHCSMAGTDVTTQSSRGLAVQVFLRCASSLVGVDRSVRVPEGAADSARRVLLAQGLLTELAERPSGAELEAGYSTDVPSGLKAGGPQGRDPEDTLRLSSPPGSLSSYALAQIVCTFSDSEAGEGDGSVILGGPSGAVRRYECTEDVRARPGELRPPSSEAAAG
ncbi:hypothetical protein [Streptomyces sp. NPDC053367]|uniref:hypothetical protein n=1 Tax=Streptomyces sp. NPDC053367 TaxID=3365700 RepID=UPI0037D67764